MTQVGNITSGRLKLVENLTDNLSGKQIYNILTNFLSNAANPVLDYSQMGRVAAAELWIRLINDRRRRISYLENKVELEVNLYNAIASNQTSKFWKLAQIERVYSYKLVMFFLTTFDHEHRRRHHDKPVEWGIDGIYLIPMMTHCRHYIDLYTQFKNLIVEKYAKYAFGMANRKAATTALHVDRNDLWQDMMLSVEYAMNKFRPEKGTMTSVINSWLSNAEKSKTGSHTYGESYGVDFKERRKLKEELASGKSYASNFALPLEAAEGVLVDEHDVTEYTMDHELIEFAKRSFGGRCFLLKHGINWSLSQSQLDKFAATQDGVK